MPRVIARRTVTACHLIVATIDTLKNDVNVKMKFEIRQTGCRIVQ